MDARTGQPAEPHLRFATPPIEPLPPGAAEMLLAHSSDALIWYGADGTILWASPALERVFGWRPSEVIGTTFRLAPPEDQERSAVEVVVDAIARGDVGVTVRSRARHADGSLGWADTAVVFIRDADGIVVGSVASIRDVTAEVEAEERYRLLAENATDMVFLRDAVGTITWASPSTRSVLGYRAGRPRRHEHDGLPASRRPAAGQSRCERRSDRARRRVESWRASACADGTYRYMSLASHPVLDESGAVVGAVGGMKDVDDLVRARMQVEHERTLLRASSDSMLDPQVLLEAVRDASGQIVDFTLRRPEPSRVRVPAPTGGGAARHAPPGDPAGTRASPACSPGMSRWSRSGVPYLITGFRYSNELLGEERYYDIRGVRAGPDLLSLTWSDVTERLRGGARRRGVRGEVPAAGGERVGRRRPRPRRTRRLGVPVGRAVVRCPAGGVGRSAHGGVHPSGRPRAGAARRRDPDARCHRHGPAADPGSRRHLPLGRVELARRTSTPPATRTDSSRPCASWMPSWPRSASSPAERRSTSSPA